MSRAALRYAESGWAVFPLKPGSKLPATSNGFKDATRDRNRIAAMFNGSTNVGAVPPEGTVVLDVDGPDAHKRLAELGYELPETAHQETPHGDHYVYRAPVKLRQTAGEICEGVDTRVAGRGYIVVAPSKVDGKSYTWTTPPLNGNISPAPQWLIDATIERPAPPRRERDTTGPIGKFNSRHTCQEILERNGYERDARRCYAPVVARYRRPGSTSGLAGVAVFDDGTCYSHHADALNDGHSHDAFDVYRLLEHDGDLQRALTAAAPAAPDPVQADSVDDRQSVQVTSSGTDLANARLLCELHGDKLRHVVPWKKWLTWDGARWALDTTGEAWRCAKSVADALADPNAKPTKVESWSGIKAMMELAATEPEVAVSPDQLDADPHLFNVTNGTLDLRTGGLRSHNPADLLTKVAGTKYDPDASAPVFVKFLEEIHPDPDMRLFLARMFGHALLGKVIEHVLTIQHGVGANGKSTLSEAVCTAFGDYAKPVDPGLLIDRGEVHPTGVASLFGLRLALTHELDSGRRLAEATVKRLTGGDRIAARRMREDFWEFDPSHSIVMHTNHRPVVKGTDEGIWRRLRLVPFDVVIPEEERDTSLPEKLAEELPGILAWIVDGYSMWAEKGLAEPKAVVDATDKYRKESDDLGAFIDEQCVVGGMGNVKSSHLFAAWAAWCEAENIKAGSNKAFSEAMELRGYTKHKSTGGAMVWDRLGLRPENRQ